MAVLTSVKHHEVGASRSARVLGANLTRVAYVACVAVVVGCSSSSDQASPGGRAGANMGGSSGATNAAGARGGGANMSNNASGGADTSSGATGGGAGSGAGSGGTSASGAGKANGGSAGALTGGGAGMPSATGSGGSQGGSAGSVSVPAGGSGPAPEAGAAGEASGGTPTEKPLAKLPAARQEHSVAALNGEIYVIGGYSGGATTVTDSVIAYDPAKDSWRTVASFPGPLNHGNAGAVNGELVVAGFYTNGGMSTATTQVYAYDPASDAWTEKSPLPVNTERAAACVAVDAGLMYVIGGAHDGMSVDNVARYDPVADTWQELASLPERREHCAAGAIGGIIYVGGGRVDGITGFEPKTWAYDPTTDAWTQKADLPTPRGGLAGGVLGGKLYVFGGEGNMNATSGVFPNIDVYDPVADAWQTVAQMLVPRHGYGAGVLGEKIYLPGGATHEGAGASDENSVFYLQ